MKCLYSHLFITIINELTFLRDLVYIIIDHPEINGKYLEKTIKCILKKRIKKIADMNTDKEN